MRVPTPKPDYPAMFDLLLNEHRRRLPLAADGYIIAQTWIDQWNLGRLRSICNNRPETLENAYNRANFEFLGQRIELSLAEAKRRNLQHPSLEYSEGNR